MERMLQDELAQDDVPSRVQADLSKDVCAGSRSQGVSSTSETNLPEVSSDLDRSIDGEGPRSEYLRHTYPQTECDLFLESLGWRVSHRLSDSKLKMNATCLRMNDQRDEAFEALESIKDRKKRVMFATLIEHLPLDKESRVAEETFVATPNTECTTQKDQGMRPDRPDIVAKISGRELLIGEVTGPSQKSYSAKNAWDLYRLARFGKSLLGDNPFAPLVQIVHTKGVYMRLTIKARGMFLLERVGTFVIPTSVDMLPSLLGTIQTLNAAK
ncbi:hypothetical protein DFQ27_004827, partial [Actinomortierella ambigua]